MAQRKRKKPNLLVPLYSSLGHVGFARLVRKVIKMEPCTESELQLYFFDFGGNSELGTMPNSSVGLLIMSIRKNTAKLTDNST